MKNNQGYIQHATHVIREAHEHGLLSDTKNDVLNGYSGESVVGSLQRLVQHLADKPGLCYLEIGVFQGFTLLSSALANPSVQHFGVDNFSLFNEQKKNLDIVTDRIRKLGIKNVEILNMDFEEALDDLDRHIPNHKIGVLFVDGAHDYRSQLVSLLKAKQKLSDEAVIVVDDANYAHVRQASADFLASHPDFALLFEAYTPAHPANMDPEMKARALKGWWDGVHIIVKDPAHLLPRVLPPTGSRTLYFNSHDAFRHEFSEFVVEFLKYGSVLVNGDEEQERKTRSLLKQLLEADRKKHPDRFSFQNTGSNGLPAFSLHL